MRQSREWQENIRSASETGWRAIPGACALHYRVRSDGEFQIWGRLSEGSDLDTALAGAGAAIRNRADFLREKQLRADGPPERVEPETTVDPAASEPSGLEQSVLRPAAKPRPGRPRDGHHSAA